MAPSINIPYQTQVGYIPCRVFKNLSYGQVPITNNWHVKKFFGHIGQIPCNEDVRQLFYDTKEYLSFFLLGDLHRMMDEVAKYHTYLNKIDALLFSAKISEEAR
jgi:spore maturation protein CgeB